jgi:hypothetical protein
MFSCAFPFQREPVIKRGRAGAFFDFLSRRGALSQESINPAFFLACQRRLALAPTLRPLSVSAGRPNQLDNLGDVEADFVLDDFTQGNIGQSESSHIGNERSAAAIQLPDTLRNQVDQEIGVRDFLHGFFDEISVHLFFARKNLFCFK